MHTAISLAELTASGVRLRPAEAVTIVGEICRQRAARLLPGLPSPAVVRFTRHGEIAIEGPVPAGEDQVARAAQLLEAMLPGFDAAPEFRASGALRLVIARAQGVLDLPPFGSLEEFCGALVRFTTLDARETVEGLVAAYRQRTLAPPIEVAAAADELAPAGGVMLAPAVTVPHAAAEMHVLPATTARPPRRHRAAYAVWVVAPAAAAALGYLLALPVARIAQPAAPEPTAAAPAPAPATKSRNDETTLPHTAPEQEVLKVEAARDTSAARDEQRRAASPTLAGPRLVQAYAYSPSFAPSGAMYFHEQRAGTSSLKIGSTADDGEVTNVTTVLDDHSRNFHPRPSPDGTRIAFDSDRDGTRGVFVANADGTNVHRVSGAGFGAVPSWSPDGQRLAFVRSEADTPRVWNLWVSDADGVNLRQVTHHKVGQAWGGSWFPDGRRIAYSVENRVIILDLQSGASRVLQSPRPGRLARTPAVSPDGRRIVFQVQHDGTWLADVATGTMERVLDDPTAEEFTWSPDGHRVAYHSRRAGAWGVWVMPV